MDSNPKGNQGELFVNTIAENIFLEYWCYPNPRDEKGDKKEICDLLITFRNTLIIISVKNYDFKDNYERYFNNTVEKALKQIQGAEKKLFGDRDIYIKHRKKEIELFDKKCYSKVFRIIVNLGRGLKFYHPSSYTKSGNHVTIMDGTAWFAITNEMNTIKDLTKYLSARERLFNKKSVVMLFCSDDEYDKNTHQKFLERMTSSQKNTEKHIYISGSELDLLASYINNSNSYPENLINDNYDNVFFDIDGTWKNFVSDSTFLGKKKKDKQSFFIDKFIINEIGYRKELKVLGEKLMSLNRFERRIVSNYFFSFYEKYKIGFEKQFARAFTDVSDYGFVFVKYPRELKGETLDKVLMLAVESFAVHTEYLRQDLILIAYYGDFKGLRYNNFELLKKYTDQEEKEIMADAKSLGWFSESFNYRKINEKEY
ncbi:NERD domain-containing protein [Seonamhaeicola marinus]|uniref:NERD domain-containing protein n=1 Tax=Seonamhaeicola marinus TaxID=1912246 RepID=A0A5D0I6M6_9FLAO|nr:NERD domain-containing protein [Seonamhaeicola marinus]TYA78541.1 NERD domain-containing protein [Seonamhaeicola marinus]